MMLEFNYILFGNIKSFSFSIIVTLTYPKDWKNWVNNNFARAEAFINNPSSIANFSRIVDVMMTAANPAINKTIDMLSKILQEAIDKIGTASVKAGLDVAGTVPGVWEVIEGVRVMDDVVKAVLASTDAIVKSMSTVSIGITDTISSFKQKMAESGNIMNRAQSNITQFTNTDVPTIPIPTPTPVQKIGGTRSNIKNKKYNKKIYKIY